MDSFEPRMSKREIAQYQTVAYIYDMIEQIADLARRSGETYAAIHLEAIIAARRALAEDRQAPRP